MCFFVLLERNKANRNRDIVESDIAPLLSKVVMKKTETYLNSEKEKFYWLKYKPYNTKNTTESDHGHIPITKALLTRDTNTNVLFIK